MRTDEVTEKLSREELLVRLVRLDYEMQELREAGKRAEQSEAQHRAARVIAEHQLQAESAQWGDVLRERDERIASLEAKITTIKESLLKVAPALLAEAYKAQDEVDAAEHAQGDAEQTLALSRSLIEATSAELGRERERAIWLEKELESLIAVSLTAAKDARAAEGKRAEETQRTLESVADRAKAIGECAQRLIDDMVGSSSQTIPDYLPCPSCPTEGPCTECKLTGARRALERCQARLDAMRCAQHARGPASSEPAAGLPQASGSPSTCSDLARAEGCVEHKSTPPRPMEGAISHCASASVRFDSSPCSRASTSENAACAAAPEKQASASAEGAGCACLSHDGTAANARCPHRAALLITHESELRLSEALSKACARQMEAMQDAVETRRLLNLEQDKVENLKDAVAALTDAARSASAAHDREIEALKARAELAARAEHKAAGVPLSTELPSGAASEPLTRDALGALGRSAIKAMHKEQGPDASGLPVAEPRPRQLASAQGAAEPLTLPVLQRELRAFAETLRNQEKKHGEKGDEPVTLAVLKAELKELKNAACVHRKMTRALCRDLLINLDRPLITVRASDHQRLSYTRCLVTAISAHDAMFDDCLDD